MSIGGIELPRRGFYIQRETESDELYDEENSNYYENINVSNFININNNIKEFEEYKNILNEKKNIEIFVYKNNPDFILLKEKINKNEWTYQGEYQEPFIEFLINDNVYSILHRLELLNYSFDTDLSVDMRDNIYLNKYISIKNNLSTYKFNDNKIDIILNRLTKPTNIIIIESVHLHYIRGLWSNKYVMTKEIKDNIHCISVVEYNEYHIKNNIDDNCCIPYAYILNLDIKDIIDIKNIFWISKIYSIKICNVDSNVIEFILIYDKNGIEYTCISIITNDDIYIYFIIENEEDKKYILNYFNK